MSADQNVIALPLGHARGNRADARLRNKLHAHIAVAVGVLQVVTELGEIFY